MRKKKAFTLIELLVVVAIIALLISILLPSLSRARELSKRLVCASNVKGMGTAFKIYANDNEDHWPTVLFPEASGSTQVRYSRSSGVEVGGGPNGNAGLSREFPTLVDTADLSNTRNLWMLVRAGDVTAKSFICPSSGDTQDNEQNIDLYYDFKGYTNVSYGYQVPFGPFSTRASEDIDPRMAVGGDKGPYYKDSPSQNDLPLNANNWGTGGSDMTPQDWKPYNSGNHGGTGTGEGQNLLFGDGHATFEKQPVVGVDKDNVFTAMSQGQNALNDGRLSGELPITYAGYNVFQGNINGDASTDSLIYP